MCTVVSHMNGTLVQTGRGWNGETEDHGVDRGPKLAPAGPKLPRRPAAPVEVAAVGHVVVPPRPFAGVVRTCRLVRRRARGERRGIPIAYYKT